MPDPTNPNGMFLSPQQQMAARQINWVRTLKGGLELTAGLLRRNRLGFLADQFRDKREALVAKQKDARTAIASIADPTVKAACNAQADVDDATTAALLAQARLDRAQNEEAGYMAIAGAADIADGMGVGSGMGGFGGGMGGGDFGSALLGGAVGGAAGAYLGNTLPAASSSAKP